MPWLIVGAAVFFLLSHYPSFAHELEGKVYCMPASGSSIVPISSAVAANPTWSPDGRRILYVTHFQNGLWFLLVSSGGQELMRIPVPPDVDVIAGVSWAPDGERIVFGGITVELNSYDVLRMKLSDENPAIRRIVSDGMNPDWSPDGEAIVFSTFRDGNFDLYLADSEGHILRNLTQLEGHDDHPSWSPDGRRIVFESTRSGNLGIHILDLATEEVFQVTNLESGQCRFPEWSPDGREILFTLDRDGESSLYRIASNGTNLKELTTGTVAAWQPTWSPDGETICFLSHGPEGFLERLGRWFE